MKLAASILGMVALFAVGCQPTASPSSTTSSPAKANEAAPEDPPSAAAKSASPADTTAEATKVEVPAELRHSGARYSGLLTGKARTYSVTGLGEAQEGGNSSRLVKVEGGRAQFERVATGALSATGTETVVVDAKGVTVTALSGGSMTAPQLELPADLKVGSKWKQTGSMTVSGMEVKQNASLEVVAEEEVKVASGTYKALKIVLNGTMSAGETTGKMTATMWYALDIGAVKIETRFTPQGQEPRSQTMELKSIR